MNEISEYEDLIRLVLKRFYEHMIKENLDKIHKRMNYSKKDRDTLIFTTPKTASTTLAFTLRKQNIPNIEKLHNFNPNLKAFQKQLMVNEEPLLWQISEYYFAKNIRLDTCRFVSLVRDPIARAVSHYFFKLRDHTVEDIEKIKIDDSFKNDLNAFIVEQTDIDFFRDIFIPKTAIDIYQYSLDRDKPYNIIHRDRNDVLIMKVESSDEYKEEALNKFFGRKDLKIIIRNQGKEMVYADLYKEFKRSVKFDKTFLNDIYSSKYVRHFYSDAEIERFIHRWS